jgi:hypothetical protein
VLQGHRYYDSTNGRFVTRDPIGQAGGINVYGYVDGDPVNGSDPSGLTVYWHHRPAFGTGLPGSGYDHWWLSTDKHPATGLSAPSLVYSFNLQELRWDILYRSHIMDTVDDNKGKNCKDDAVDMHFTKEQEARLDVVIHNVKEGWIMDGVDWNNALYDPSGIYHPNCQRFVLDLLDKAGRPGVPGMNAASQVTTDLALWLERNAAQ